MSKKKKKAKARSPEVILQEKLLEAQRLEKKIAEDKAKNNPVFDPIRERIEDLQKKQITNSKGFGSGAQSFNNRIQAKQLWIDQIEAERSVALAETEANKSEISLLRSAMSRLLKEGETSYDAISNAIAEVEREISKDFEHIVRLRESVELATDKRKAFSSEVKTPARKRANQQEN